MKRAWIPGVMFTTAALAASFTGCYGIGHSTSVESPLPLGAVTDPHWHAMVTNAQSSDFVIYQHEFIGATAQLNQLGQDHVKQIARRLADVPFPVVIEPVSFRPFDNRQFEEKEFTDVNRERREVLEVDRARRDVVDADRRAEIDAARRQEIVHFLSSLGYPYANERVFVAPAYAIGISGIEGARNYNQTLNQNGNGNGAFGGRGGFGGGFGGGGFGGGF